MSLREAAQQALEALEKVKHGQWEEDSREGRALITALRAALAEEALQRLTDVHQEIEAALEQQEQEPVAWMVTTEMQDGTRRTYPLTGRYKDVLDCCDFGEPVPLYTHPPRREWRGLTEEEIERITSNLMTSGDGYLRFSVSLLDFARAFEAKLKERNA